MHRNGYVLEKHRSHLVVQATLITTDLGFDETEYVRRTTALQQAYQESTLPEVAIARAPLSDLDHKKHWNLVPLASEMIAPKRLRSPASLGNDGSP